MPLYQAPIETDSMGVQFLVPDYEGYPPHKGKKFHSERTGGVHQGTIKTSSPRSHEQPGRAQDDTMWRPTKFVSAGWPVQKGSQLNRHPGHPNQDIHDPKKRKHIVRQAMQAVTPLKAERKNFTPAQRRQILGDNPKCVWCKYESSAKTPEARRKEFDVDHIIAVSKGGSNEKISTLRPACAACNRARGNKPVSRWREWVQRSRWLRANADEKREAARESMAEAFRRLRAQPA